MSDLDGMNLLDAAVLVPVFRDTTGELRLVMIRRTTGGIHGGQLAFPGGRPRTSATMSALSRTLGRSRGVPLLQMPFQDHLAG